MRLTPDLVAEGDAGLNCLGDRELLLRNMAIPAIENLAIARDSYDLIDLTSNAITSLGDGFPPFPRLHTLYLSHNRIQNVAVGLAASLPNLRTLILTSNKIASLEALNLSELAKLSQLEVLSLVDNPIMTTPHVRESVVAALPSLKLFNFSKISAKERATKEATQLSTTQKNRSKKNRKRRRLLSTEPEHASDEDRRVAKKVRKLTPEQSRVLRERIEKAASIKEVTQIQEVIRSGNVLDFLESLQTDVTTGANPT